MTGKEIYDLAVQRVNEAHQTNKPDMDSLINTGFEKKDLNEGVKLSGRIPHELFSIIGDDGYKVEVEYYAYDPTKSFSPIEPDINKYRVSLYNSDNTEIEKFNDSFSDKPYGS